MFARTERLLLRPGWIEDAPALFEGIADEGIVRNLASAPWPYTLADAESFLRTDRMASEPCFLVFLRTAGAPQLVGTVGFGRRPTGETEFGYWIARPHWGRGYATEAGRAALDLARDSLRLGKVNGSHFLDNPASGRVLEKLGFRPTGVIAPRYSAGRGDAAPCRLLELDLQAERVACEAELEPALEMMAA
jgi:RimJ/RimL family protein N-acetyltransferase